MKQIIEFLDAPTVKKRKELSKQLKAKLMVWALDAYKLDKTRPTKFYYNLFLGKLREAYKTSEQKERFFDEVIEI